MLVIVYSKRFDWLGVQLKCFIVQLKQVIHEVLYLKLFAKCSVLKTTH